MPPPCLRPHPAPAVLGAAALRHRAQNPAVFPVSPRLRAEVHPWPALPSVIWTHFRSESTPFQSPRTVRPIHTCPSGVLETARHAPASGPWRALFLLPGLLGGAELESGASARSAVRTPSPGLLGPQVSAGLIPHRPNCHVFAKPSLTTLFITTTPCVPSPPYPPSWLISLQSLFSQFDSLFPSLF